MNLMWSHMVSGVLRRREDSGEHKRAPTDTAPEEYPPAPTQEPARNGSGFFHVLYCFASPIIATRGTRAVRLNNFAAMWATGERWGA